MEGRSVGTVGGGRVRYQVDGRRRGRWSSVRRGGACGRSRRRGRGGRGWRGQRKRLESARHLIIAILLFFLRNFLELVSILMLFSIILHTRTHRVNQSSPKQTASPQRLQLLLGESRTSPAAQGRWIQEGLFLGERVERALRRRARMEAWGCCRRLIAFSFVFFSCFDLCGFDWRRVARLDARR
ncbi:hypothetical protein IWZ00DRAFT_515187 [Phyllosticta capitalensis]